QHRQPDRPCPDRQGRGRHRRGTGAGRRAPLRNRRRQLRLSPMRQRLPMLLAALWWGSLTTLGALVVPLLFVHLATPAVAGHMAARLFAAQTWVSLGCGLVLLMISRPKGASAQYPW